MVLTFEWKQLPFQRPRRLEVDSKGAVLTNHRGKVKARFEFAAVRRLRFASMGEGRRGTMRWFDAVHDKGRFRLQCNTKDADDPAVDSYESAVGAIMLGIAQQKPGLEVDLGVGRRMRGAMFLIGAAIAALGVVAFVASFRGGKRDSPFQSFIVMIMLGGVGWVLMRLHPPFAVGPFEPVATVARGLCGKSPPTVDLPDPSDAHPDAFLGYGASYRRRRGK